MTSILRQWPIVTGLGEDELMGNVSGEREVELVVDSPVPSGGL